MVRHLELADPDDDTVHSMLHELLGYLDRNATCMCCDELDFYYNSEMSYTVPVYISSRINR